MQIKFNQRANIMLDKLFPNWFRLLHKSKVTTETVFIYIQREKSRTKKTTINNNQPTTAGHKIQNRTKQNQLNIHMRK